MRAAVSYLFAIAHCAPAMCKYVRAPTQTNKRMHAGGSHPRSAATKTANGRITINLGRVCHAGNVLNHGKEHTAAHLQRLKVQADHIRHQMALVSFFVDSSGDLAPKNKIWRIFLAPTRLKLKFFTCTKSRDSCMFRLGTYRHFTSDLSSITTGR